MPLRLPRVPPHHAGPQAWAGELPQSLTMVRATSSRLAKWGTQALWDVLSPHLPGLSIEVVERMGSTNGELVERLRVVASSGRSREVRADDLNPCLLVAEHQTQGRGRLGRAWESSAGASLTFSLSLPLQRADWSGLSLAVGLCVAEALDPEGQHLGLKWPNDLWLRDGSHRKLGGILIEALTVGQVRVAVIGIGLNIQPLGPSVAALSEVHPGATAPWALAKLMPRLVQGLQAFDHTGFGGFVEAYAKRDILRGRTLTTTDPGCLLGLAEGVDVDGALLLRGDAGPHRIVSGEVSVRPVQVAY
ncbi:MAG: biotin--[acetyl-CoA-carboxylase] ligase [Ideonella sp. MAG2]|nr:MAG: biotin--[acetyl-CoA-carboxylase] ligase [Ideonella sp. MAG2]